MHLVRFLIFLLGSQVAIGATETEALVQLGGAQSILKTLQSQTACSTRPTAALCQAVTWNPRVVEGMWDMGQSLIVVYEYPQKDSTTVLADVMARIHPDYVDRHLSLYALASPKFIESLSNYSYVWTVVIAVKRVGIELKAHSLLVARTADIFKLGTPFHQTAFQELLGKTSGWVPPVEPETIGEFFKF